MQYELRHQAVIDRIGAPKLADALGLPRSTVHSWRQARAIPVKHHTAILEAATRLGVDLSPSDFIVSVQPGAAVAATHNAQN